MISVTYLLNKIKYDKNLNPEGHPLPYLDRITKGLIEISYKDIKKVEIIL
ncbi:hypothetical protein ISS05_03775 [Candidatus Woesearchaeota archaeon]|nr:hypothetical protein [Candidatus Woesearchaeota archaeon]